MTIETPEAKTVQSLQQLGTLVSEIDLDALSEAERRRLSSYLKIASQRWELTARPSQIPPTGDWNIWLILAGRGWGKSLDLFTPLPTPGGWTMMGCVKVGDQLLDENMKPTTVTATFDVPNPRYCYEIVFSDCPPIKACGDHQWVVEHTDDREVRYDHGITFSESEWWKKPTITTREMYNELRAWNCPDSVYSIPHASGGYNVSDSIRQFLRRGDAVRGAEHFIKDIVPIAPRPMRCVTVDSPNSLYLAGEGLVPTHNTRCGAETVLNWIKTGQCSRVHLVARSAADARDTMIEGPSGILNIAPKNFMPHYSPSKRRLTFPNGAVAIHFTAEEPRTLRGPECDAWWADELASWPAEVNGESAWDMLQFGARRGKNVRGIITTTPKPIPLLKELLDRATKETKVRVTTGSTFENEDNLADNFIETLRSEYDGTRLGRQEIYAEILGDNPDALWTDAMIARMRISIQDQPKSYGRTVVAIDPAASVRKNADMTGIVIASASNSSPRSYYVRLDASLHQARPEEWASKAVRLYREFHASHIIAEVNNGGEMVRAAIHAVDPSIPFKAIRASKGKLLRAEPISALSEKGRVFLVGSYPHLESQMTQYSPMTTGYSPDRLDAFVYAISELHGTSSAFARISNVIPDNAGRAQRHWTSKTL